MGTAKGALTRLSQDPEAVWLARELGLSLEAAPASLSDRPLALAPRTMQAHPLGRVRALALSTFCDFVD